MKKDFIGNIMNFQYTLENFSMLSQECRLRSKYLQDVFRLFNRRLVIPISFIEFMAFYAYADSLFYDFVGDTKSTIYYIRDGKSYKFSVENVKRGLQKTITINRLKLLESCFQDICIEIVGEDSVKEKQEIFERYNLTYYNKFTEYIHMMLDKERGQWE